jgi:hypothetical protein
LSSYTELELKIIKDGVESGRSASQIAKDLPGRTRNAVIGVATRKGWKMGGYSAARLTERQARPAPTRVPPPKPAPRLLTNANVPVFGAKPGPTVPPMEIPVTPITSPAVSIMALTAGMCRNPVGKLTGADQLFCARQTAAKKRGDGGGIGGFETYCQACKPRLSKATPGRR